MRWFVGGVNGFLGENMEELAIVVNRDALLQRLRKNRERFHASLEAVLKAYKKKSEDYQKKYGEYVQKVADRKVKDSYREQPNPPPEPQDRIKDYDFYIDMLTNHSNPTVEVTEELFRRLWNDKWEWTPSHYRTMMYYASAGGSGAIGAIADLASAYSGD